MSRWIFQKELFQKIVFFFLRWCDNDKPKTGENGGECNTREKNHEIVSCGLYCNFRQFSPQITFSHPPDSPPSHKANHVCGVPPSWAHLTLRNLPLPRLLPICLTSLLAGLCPGPGTPTPLPHVLAILPKRGKSAMFRGDGGL